MSDAAQARATGAASAGGVALAVLCTVNFAGTARTRAFTAIGAVAGLGVVSLLAFLLAFRLKEPTPEGEKEVTKEQER